MTPKQLEILILYKFTFFRVILSNVFIEDRPVYAYRGLLLDTSRNFIPLSQLLKTLDGMAMTKLNYFHWHITDAQSFPLEIPEVPYLSEYGSYSKEKVYKESDVRHIVKYAQQRGIKVVFELDSPAHAAMGNMNFLKSFLKL